jgi:hypothetical protein
MLNGVLIAWVREHVSMIMMESHVEERSDLYFFFRFLSWLAVSRSSRSES